MYISKYYKLPLISGEYSYSFTKGDSSEIFICKKHGAYTKKIIGNRLNDIIQYCNTIQPINWLEAIDLAYKNPPDPERYIKQNQMVYIYNPDNINYSDILIKETDFNGEKTLSLAYEEIFCDNKCIWIPEHYQIKIFEFCPKCLKELQKKQKKTNMLVIFVF